MFSKIMSLGWLALAAVLVWIGVNIYGDVRREERWHRVESEQQVLRMYEVPAGRVPELDIALSSLLEARVISKEKTAEEISKEKGRVTSFNGHLLVNAPESVHASIQELINKTAAEVPSVSDRPKVYELWFLHAAQGTKLKHDARLSELQSVLEGISKETGLNEFSGMEYVRYTAALEHHRLRINRTPLSKTMFMQKHDRLEIDAEMGSVAFSSMLKPKIDTFYVLGVGTFPASLCQGTPRDRCDPGQAASLVVIMRVREAVEKS